MPNPFYVYVADTSSGDQLNTCHPESVDEAIATALERLKDLPHDKAEVHIYVPGSQPPDELAQLRAAAKKHGFQLDA